MTTLDLDAIEARATAATPGPWVPGENYDYFEFGSAFDSDECPLCATHGRYLHREPSTLERPYGVVTEWLHYHAIKKEHRARLSVDFTLERWHSVYSVGAFTSIITDAIEDDDGPAGGIVSTPADTAFIMSARADVPALVAEIRRLRAERTARLAELVETLRGIATNTGDPEVAHSDADAALLAFIGVNRDSSLCDGHIVHSVAIND